MAAWTPFPFDASAYQHGNAALASLWPRLHAGDAEPLPADPAMLAAWAFFHGGQFEQAVAAGMQAGGSGITAANKAQLVYANHLETGEAARLALFWQVAERAEAQLAREPLNPNAHFMLASALGRYGQGISIAKALSQGLGHKVKTALETAIRLAPTHAEAHLALGVFHAEVIDKVGTLLGHTQGASKDLGLALFKTALRLDPRSPIVRIECARGLVMLGGEQRQNDATRLYEEAAASEPLDAMEHLDVVRAQAELAG